MFISVYSVCLSVFIVCVYNECLSCVFIMCVYNECLSCVLSRVFITCVYHVCLSRVFIMCVYHVCLSRVFITCVYHVCLSCVFIMCVSFCFKYYVCNLAICNANGQWRRCTENRYSLFIFRHMSWLCCNTIWKKGFYRTVIPLSKWQHKQKRHVPIGTG